MPYRRFSVEWFFSHKKIIGAFISLVFLWTLAIENDTVKEVSDWFGNLITILEYWLDIETFAIDFTLLFVVFDSFTDSFYITVIVMVLTLLTDGILGLNLFALSSGFALHPRPSFLWFLLSQS